MGVRLQPRGSAVGGHSAGRSAPRRGDPWWNVAIRLMLECRNLYLKTSAYAPKYFPPELLHFMNTRGQDKGIFASDHPALSMERALGEARALALRPGVTEKFRGINPQLDAAAVAAAAFAI